MDKGEKGGMVEGERSKRREKQVNLASRFTRLGSEGTFGLGVQRSQDTLGLRVRGDRGDRGEFYPGTGAAVLHHSPVVTRHVGHFPQ